MTNLVIIFVVFLIGYMLHKAMKPSKDNNQKERKTTVAGESKASDFKAETYDEMMKKMNRSLKEQDRQLTKFKKAEELEKEGKVEEAISILEDICFKEGIIVNGTTWPFILPKIYLKHGMNDKCWAYLNYIFDKGWTTTDKIRDLQATILKNEKKYIDSLYSKMTALLTKYHKTPVNEVEPILLPFIKRAKITDKKDEIIKLYQAYLSKEIFNEGPFRDEFKEILK
jgi:hypothetical protein